MTMRMNRFLAALTIALTAACGPAAPVARAASAGDATLALDDAGAKRAIEAALSELRGKDWLAAPALALVSVGEVASEGARYRLAALVKDGARQRPVRLEVTKTGPTSFHLTRATLGPVGDEVLNADVPPLADRPGGWTAQRPGDRETTAAGAEAAKLLTSADWLNRPVRWTALSDARTQVVAGTNVYLAGTASVGGRTRPVALVLYQPLSGASTLSWVSLGEAQ